MKILYIKESTKSSETEEVFKVLKERPDLLKLFLLVGDDERLIDAALSAIKEIKMKKGVSSC